jgi:hypothetical protein
MVHIIFCLIQRTNEPEILRHKGKNYSYIKAFKIGFIKLLFYTKSYENYNYFLLSYQDFLVVSINQGIYRLMVLSKYFTPQPSLLVSLW